MSNTHNTKGRYEGNAQPMKAAVIDRLSSDHGVDVDHSFGDGHWVGAFQVYGRAYLLIEDTNGFFTAQWRPSYADAVADVEACQDDEDAQDEYEDLLWSKWGGTRTRYNLV